MLGRRIALLRQVLLFVLVTLLGIATGYLTNERRPPAALRMLDETRAAKVSPRKATSGMPQ